MQVRVAACRILTRLASEAISLDLLLDDFKKQIAAEDRALLQNICYGVCRWYWRLGAMAEQHLQKKLKAKDSDIFHVLLIGLYQLHFMRIPEHAAVNETVNVCKAQKKLWAKNLVNAVLRQSLRETFANSERQQQSHYSFPQWWIDKIQTQYPQQWASILEASNQHPPMSLRVNVKQNSKSDYQQQLQAQQIEAQEHPLAAHALVLQQATDVSKLPGFEQGAVSVQDVAAQLCTRFLSLQNGQRVLDACAAPGGKTAAMLESCPQLDMIAIDKSKRRAQAVTQTLLRLNLNASTLVADAADTLSWWDGKLFDRILLDAPCSGSGVVRRHPDIKLQRHADDISTLRQTQASLLKQLWPLLQPGGLMLYATCSVFAEENQMQIQHFLTEHDDATLPAIELSGISPAAVGLQILPGEQDMDGFYYALLQKLG